jgi:mannose-6-phosphate isomerase-like protein (cupin superfamily)
MKFLASLLGIAALLCAAEPAGFVHWNSKDLKGFEQKLKPKMNELKIGLEQLGAWGNHTAGVAHREADGEAEVHETMADFFVVESGEATLVVGGQVVGGKTTAPNEIRGPKINGGERRKLAAGDIVHIPVKAPHQLLVENGKQFTYFVIKVQK